MKKPLCKAWLDLNTLQVTHFDVPSMEVASKTLSWYAAEAPGELKGMIKVIRIKRVR